MVRRKNTRQANVYYPAQSIGHASVFKQKKCDSSAMAAVAASRGSGNSGFAQNKVKKNELLYPTSPYDEIPTIRDLVNQLSPCLIRNYEAKRQQNEARQEHQQIIESYQQREGTAPPFDNPISFPRFSDDAHEVPNVIEVPATCSYSEGSELSLEACLRRYDDNHACQRSLSPHPTDENDFKKQPIPLDIHHLNYDSLRVNQALDWPSDEDDVSPSTTRMKTKKREKSTKKIYRCH